MVKVVKMNQTAKVTIDRIAEYLEAEYTYQNSR